MMAAGQNIERMMIHRLFFDDILVDIDVFEYLTKRKGDSIESFLL